MKKRYLFILAVALILSSCMHMETIPYAVTEPECVIGKVDGIHEFVGLHFTFYNNSEKSINKLKFSFIVFDSTGESSPFIGSNILTANYTDSIAPSESHDVVFSLDSYTSEIPTEPYIIDFFYITKIEYDDGSDWSDPYGFWIPGGL